MAACKHESFDAKVNVNRVEDIGRFSADVSIRCTGCGKPFRFLGLPMGLDYGSPTVSVEGTEARMPIACVDESVAPIDGPQGFSIRRRV